MSELIKPPAVAQFQFSLSSADLSAKLVKQRILSIKSYLKGEKRVYSAVTVSDTGLGGGWNGKIDGATLKTTLGAKYFLTALDCFEEQKKTYCAAAWVDGAKGLHSNWSFDLTAGDLNKLLEKEHGKLISIRAYKTTLGGKLATAALRYCAIWVPDDGAPWGWAPDANEDSISDTLDANGAELISIDNLDNAIWLGDQEHFCAVWYKNLPGQNWFWNYGLDSVSLPKEPPKFCSWPLDVSYCDANRFVSLMIQYPAPQDPALANLMTIGGSANATFRDDLWMDLSWNLSEQNLVGEKVDMETAIMLSAAEGGWSWWSGNIADPQQVTPNVFGLPASLAASASYNSTPGGTVSNPPKRLIVPIKAKTSSGKHQFLMSQAQIAHAGFPTPAPMPIHWPIFLGVQGPVEAIKLTNGKLWITVVAQVVNGTAQKLDITHVSVKLKDQNNVTIHKANMTDKLLIDADVLGAPLNSFGAVVGSDAPLPKFYDAFEVPSTFTKGKVKIQANVEFASPALGCAGDARTMDVGLAPITNMSRLPYATPTIEGVPNSAYRWRWGNGVGGVNFNAHSYPEHRYSYDLGVIDAANSTFKDATKLDQNDNFYCWGQPILAMSAGKVIFVGNDFEDHFGRTKNPNSKGANIVVVQNETSDFYHHYVHCKQHSIVVKVGDMVQPGDKLGLVGNSGGSSEPHLHIGVSRRDSEGFLRSLPMTFQKVKDSSNKVVSGVPVDGETYA